MKVVLELDRGPGAGRRFEVAQHVYRAIGRHEDAGDGIHQTVVLNESAPMDADDHALVVAHLERREAALAQAEPSASPREGSFLRGADILLDDALTSRTHAMVFVDELGASLVDLGSTNGTFVNAEPVSDAELTDGDVIHIGRARLIVSVQGS